MKESGSKRSASCSPLRGTKRRRDYKRKDDSADDSTKKSEEETPVKKFDDTDLKRTSKRKVRTKSEKKSKQGKDDKKRGNSSDRSGTEDSENDSKSSIPSEVELAHPSPKVSRYWGGEPEKPALEDGELSNHSHEEDYEVGNRYYDAKPEDKKTVQTEKDPDADYVVGKRYYEDKPEVPGENTEKENDATKKDDTAKVSVPTRRAKLDDPLLSRTGGAYIPPAKLRLMQASITDKSSISYQRIAWEALKKSIHGHINKVNTSNIGIIARLLMKENIVRGRGLLCKSILQAQAASTTFTNVYACLVSVINSKFPNIGELLMKRVILQFKRGFKRNDKALCIASCQFIAHLVNQQVAHEILALEMLTLLLESPTDDSVEVAVAFLKEVGQKLLELSPKGTNAIFDMLRNILHQGNLEKRVQYMIEVVFQVRKDGFRSFESVDENLDLVEEEDRYTHILTLDEAVDPDDLLNVFKHDPEYELNEDKYKALKEEIVGGSSSEEESGDEGSDEDSDEEGSDGEEGGKESKSVTIIDETETNLVALRRTIYLTIQSSLDFEECCHKLLKMDIKPGQEPELCHMLLDCCAELRTYEKFFGLLAQRFCQINRVYIAPLEEMFAGSYGTVHRLDTNKLRNVARFFGHLLFTDAISWQVLESVRLNEEDTTSSSRIFIKILFQELAEYMGLAILNQRLKDPTLQTAMEGLFPRDNPKNTRFAINFFTSIGLGGLTDDLREHLKTQPKPSAVSQLVDKLDMSSDSSSSSSSSDSSDDSSSDSDSSSNSEGEKRKNRKKKVENAKKKKEDKKKGGEEPRSKEKPHNKDRSDKVEKDLKVPDKKVSDKRTKSNDEVNRKKRDEEGDKREHDMFKKNSDKYRNDEADEIERKREKCKKYRDMMSRDKGKYEENEHYKKLDKNRDDKGKYKEKEHSKKLDKDRDAKDKYEYEEKEYSKKLEKTRDAKDKYEEKEYSKKLEKNRDDKDKYEEKDYSKKFEKNRDVKDKYEEKEYSKKLEKNRDVKDKYEEKEYSKKLEKNRDVKDKYEEKEYSKKLEKNRDVKDKYEEKEYSKKLEKNRDVKDKYEEKEYSKKFDKERDNDTRDKKPGKDLHKQDYDRYEEKRRNTREDTKEYKRGDYDAGRDKEKSKEYGRDDYDDGRDKEKSKEYKRDDYDAGRDKEKSKEYKRDDYDAGRDKEYKRYDYDAGRDKEKSKEYKRDDYDAGRDKEKSKEYKRDDYDAGRDKENRKKEYNRDQGKDRDRIDDRYNRDDKDTKYTDSETMRKNKERTYDDTRYQKDKAQRRNRS